MQIKMIVDNNQRNQNQIFQQLQQFGNQLQGQQQVNKKIFYEWNQCQEKTFDIFGNKSRKQVIKRHKKFMVCHGM